MRLAVVPVLALTSWSVCGQTASAQLTFEVASIKPSAPDTPGTFLQPEPGGNLRMIGNTLKNLIAYAYGVREFTISGVPDWGNSNRFDIDARVGASPGTPQQIPERLRALLAERFQLACHTESKMQDVYALVVAKNGPKLIEAKPGSGPMIRRRGASITGEGVAIPMLVMNLANSLERPVLDKTGLAGKYDFKLEWSLDANKNPAAIAATGANSPAAPDPTGPSLFSACQEQLGLRLEAQKALAETLVIDHVARPSQN
jgi:uncharacterized protein (TIGR03435 family)